MLHLRTLIPSPSSLLARILARVARPPALIYPTTAVSMHRAVVRAYRTTNLSAVRRSLTRSSRARLLSSDHSANSTSKSNSNFRSSSFSFSSHFNSKAPHPFVVGSNVPLKSSMYFRRLPAALVSGLVVGYGAWYFNNSNSTIIPSQSAVTRSLTTAGTETAAVPTRTVLVVGADELRQGTIVGDGPISKSTSDDGRKIVEMLTPEQATNKIRKLEQSFSVNRGQGVTRYDLVQLPSNDPIEDDHAEKIVQVPGHAAGEDTDWMFWGVFDGHSGWTTSATLRERLINFVATELNDTYKATPKGLPTSEAIDLAIKTGFNRLDDEIVHKSVDKVFKASSKNVAAELLQPALSGSCALLSFYDSQTNMLRVACTGDSRAVLGRRSESGKWTATALSEDQTGSNPNEASRMRKEHPGEDHVVRNGRVLGGLEPTRAFGDAVYKWSRETAFKLKEKFFGRTPSALLKTPPYVTAEPVVTSTKIQPDRGDFLVLATDGLWEMLTNEEVVGLVGQWIESQAKGGSNSQFEVAWSKIFGSSGSPLPVEKGTSGGPDGQKTPIRLQQWGVDPEAKDRFVVKDKNVATHLVRNALGGSNEEQVCALLTLPSPFSRRYRDDLTVQVIFFGHGPKTGEVTVNPDASAGGAPKAKL